MAEKFSLKDHLFNRDTISQLAREYAGAVDGFDPDRFVQACLDGFPNRELLERLDWIADQLEVYLPSDFPAMADALERAMPAALDSCKTDDDFGHFIHACPGILAVRHGLAAHVGRALDLIHAATQRFSMEFYIRPFITMHPDITLPRLAVWARDDNYHVRRLVSEGTRPRLPWAKKVSLDVDAALSFLDILHADPTRYVTRSVANHLNDIAKTDPDRVIKHLTQWRDMGQQSEKELNWMARHALRTLIKDGHTGAMRFLGYDPDVDVRVTNFQIADETVVIGDALNFAFQLSTSVQSPVIVDYILHLRKSNGETVPKVFKLKTTELAANTPTVFRKKHKLKGDATTFRLFAGEQVLELQVNGKRVAKRGFQLTQ